MAEGNGKGAAKENAPVKHIGILSRIHWQTLFIRVNNTTDTSKADDAKLQAAAYELEETCGITIKSGGRFWYSENLDQEEVIALELSDKALRGIKLAVVRFLTNPQSIPAFAVRKDTLNACAGFGQKFRKMVELEAKLPDGQEAEDEAPLDIAEDKLVPVNVKETPDARS